MSAFLIRIERADGSPVSLKPGSTGERDLVEAIIAKGVGVFTTSNQVRLAIEAVLTELKSEVVPSH